MKWQNPSLIKLITGLYDRACTYAPDPAVESKPMTLEDVEGWFDLLPDWKMPPYSPNLYSPNLYTKQNLKIYPWDFTELKSPKMDMRYHFMHNYIALVPRPYSLSAWSVSGLSDLSATMQQEVDAIMEHGKKILRWELLVVLCKITLKKIDEEERSDHDTTR